VKRLAELQRAERDKILNLTTRTRMPLASVSGTDGSNPACSSGESCELQSVNSGAGLAMVGVGFVLLAVLPAHPDTVDILWRIAVCGGGMGLFQQPNARAIIIAAPGRRHRGRDACDRLVFATSARS